jgi:hypothetical protein
MALCRSLLMGVFYEFTFALLLIEYYIFIVPSFFLSSLGEKIRASTNADPYFQQQKLIG